jgi:alkaline phosphatase D
MQAINRRWLLGKAAAAPLILPMGTWLAGCATSAGFLSHDPFALGVASGSPRHDSVVLWTRLLGEKPGQTLDTGKIQVSYEVASDARFTRVVAKGDTWAYPQLAHAVHIEVSGLPANQVFWYRFMVGQGAKRISSPIGRTKTLPAPDATIRHLRFAYASCQQYEQGYFGAYRRMLEDAPDLVMFVGDYIYESSWGRNLVRSHASNEAVSLAEYRARYALYKSDKDLQAMHAWCPWLTTWDDHEVDNDYAGNVDAKRSPDFMARRAAAYQAFFEHMPLRFMARLQQRPAEFAKVDWALVQLYGQVSIGKLANVFVLDDRQYRDPQPCNPGGRGGSSMTQPCALMFDPALSLLGKNQEAWLEDALRGSSTKFNLIMQQTLFAKANYGQGLQERYWNDGWDGYQASRERLLSSVAGSPAGAAVWIGGDVHSHWVCDIPASFAGPKAPLCGVEFCGTSITSAAAPQARLQAILPQNPHIKWVDSTMRGYGLVDVSSSAVVCHLRGVNEKLPDPALIKQASFSWQGRGTGVSQIA